MVPGHGETFPDKLAADLLHHLPGQAVNNPALPLVPFQIIHQRGILILGVLDGKVKIGTVKTRGHHLGVPEHKDVDDIVPYLGRGGCCKRAYNRPHRQPVYKIHNLQITWPEVLSPLGHTVGLIHCHHGYLHLPIQGKPQEILGHQPLRRHIDNGIPACPRQIKDLIILGRGQGTVNIGGQDPRLV